MKYIYKYEDSMRQCEILLTENVVKLSEYSNCLLQSSSISSSESTRREKKHEIMEKLDTVQETIATLKSEYNDLTQHYLKSTSLGINFKKKFFNYLARQETLRLKFIKTIKECKLINSHLINILRDCSVDVEALNENCNQNTSIRGGFDLSSIPKAYVLLPRLDLDCHNPVTSFSNEHAAEVGTSPAAFVSESLPVSSSDLNTDVAVKKCDSTTVLEPKKLKNWTSSKRNEVSDLSQSLVCSICHRSISNKEQMKRHMFLHEGLKPFECADCGKSFARKENMKSHIFSMHMASAIQKKVSDSRQSAVCNICGKHVSRQRDLKRHMLIHERLKPFKCAECGESFRRKFVMDQHIRLCHSLYHTRSCKCDICSKRFAARFRLNTHKRLAGHCSPKLSKFTSENTINDGVTTVKKHDSSTIVLGAKKVGKLVSSKRKKNSNSSRLFVCGVCHRNYSRRQHLKRHLILHETPKPFKCSKCDKPFTRTDHLKRHMLRVHVTDNSDQLTLDSYYYCAHCKYRCQFKESLVYHIKKEHISDLSLEEFSCTVCGKTFMNRQIRANHEQWVHVRKKCFCCMNCGMRYKHDKGLERHLKLKQCVPK